MFGERSSPCLALGFRLVFQPSNRAAAAAASSASLSIASEGISILSSFSSSGLPVLIAWYAYITLGQGALCGDRLSTHRKRLESHQTGHEELLLLYRQVNRRLYQLRQRQLWSK